MAAPTPEVSYSEKLRGAEYLTAISALVLFITTFTAWFELPSIDTLKSIAPDAQVIGSGSSGTINLNVWDLHFGRWFIYLTILLAVWMVLAAVFSANPEWSVILATPTVVVSGIAMLCMLYRLLESPRATASPTTIFYVAFVATIGVFAGSFWAIRDERVPPGFVKTPQPEVIRVDGAS
jgi:hypothetical protein